MGVLKRILAVNFSVFVPVLSAFSGNINNLLSSYGHHYGFAAFQTEISAALMSNS